MRKHSIDFAIGLALSIPVGVFVAVMLWAFTPADGPQSVGTDRWPEPVHVTTSTSSPEAFDG